MCCIKITGVPAVSINIHLISLFICIMNMYFTCTLLCCRAIVVVSAAGDSISLNLCMYTCMYTCIRMLHVCIQCCTYMYSSWLVNPSILFVHINYIHGLILLATCSHVYLNNECYLSYPYTITINQAMLHVLNLLCCVV